MSPRILRYLQYLLLSAGLVLLAGFGLARMDSSVASRTALEAFDQAQAAAGTTQAAAGTTRERGSEPLPAEGDVDFSLWSEKRVREYRQSLSTDKRLPLAVLSISKLRIRVPVLEGTDDLALNRGAGWIDGTARPGEDGNVGIAAHRDGFFRGLKDITVGDAIELATLKGRTTYVVDQIEIVTPEHVEVLQPRAEPSVTLVTCYPFYFVGDAPQRFIVHAKLDRTGSAERQDSMPR